MNASSALLYAAVACLSDASADPASPDSTLLDLAPLRPFDRAFRVAGVDPFGVDGPDATGAATSGLAPLLASLQIHAHVAASDATPRPASPGVFPRVPVEAAPFPRPPADASGRPGVDGALVRDAERAGANPERALVFLERYGSFLPVSGAHPDVPLFDAVKMAAAVQTGLDAGDAEAPFLFVEGDLSGIQDFVYTITSTGALKTLRGNSFLLEMLVEHVLYELIAPDDAVTRASIVYRGGGGFVVLLPNTKTRRERCRRLRRRINRWLLEAFDGVLFFGLATHAATEEAVQNAFPAVRSALQRGLERAKATRFADHLDGLFEPRLPVQLTNREACAISRRDTVPEGRLVDLHSGRPWSTAMLDEPERLPVVDTFHHLYHLGNRLTCYRAVYRVAERPKRPGSLAFPTLDATQNGGRAYYVVDTEADDAPWSVPDDVEAAWSVNRWDTSGRMGVDAIPLLTARSVRAVADLPSAIQDQEVEALKDEYGAALGGVDPSQWTASFAGLASVACGADLVGALRMDVDDLGVLMADGLGPRTSLATTSALSRQLSLFFTLYLTRLCEEDARFDPYSAPPAPLDTDDASTNGTAHPGDGQAEAEAAADVASEAATESTSESNVEVGEGRNVSVIYAGGDDLFVVGAWDEVALLAFDVQDAFKRFAGHNPDVGLSGGVTLHKPNFPLYQIAQHSGEAEAEAKAVAALAPGHPDTRRPRKQRVALFYTREMNVRRSRLEERLAADPLVSESEMHRLGLARPWDEAAEGVANGLGWFRLELSVEKGLLRARLPKDVPGGLPFRLLQLVEMWQERGVLYIPDLLWLTSKQRRGYDDRMALLNLLRGPHRRHLHVPLTWISYLTRTG